MGREYIEMHSKWVVINRVKFEDYYRSLYEHQDKYLIKLETLTEDINICERYYEINFIR